VTGKSSPTITAPLDCSLLRSAAAQVRRQAKLDTLAPKLDAPLTPNEERLHSMSLSQLVDACNSGSISRRDILLTYGKKAYAAQIATNCLSDVMIGDLLCDPSNLDRSRKSGIPIAYCTDHEHHNPASSATGPLAGVPVSIKDCIDVAGYPTTLGFSSRASTPAVSSAAIVDLLRDAGAVMHVKTTIPCGVFGLETTSMLFGRTSNPHNPAFSPGASTGGGGALLASGGSMIEVGTDIGGSVRIPAAWCGVYALKSSVGRFPFSGCHTSAPGLESLPTIASPMARTLEDLSAFWEATIQMKPWEYDHTVRAAHTPLLCANRLTRTDSAYLSLGGLPAYPARLCGSVSCGQTVRACHALTTHLLICAGLWLSLTLLWRWNKRFSTSVTSVQTRTRSRYHGTPSARARCC
jgi:Asp-tRNA(Asn)/Glu-tRNA(Gln) amidotransferase A subunit family amidase